MGRYLASCLSRQETEHLVSLWNIRTSMSQLSHLQVIRSNNFAVSPVLLTTPTLDGFDVRFQVPWTRDCSEVLVDS